MTQSAPSGASSEWRPDIDGLRSIAIGAVLLFHFDLLGAEGGFVGVDIFFVISGYLMTSMLARSGAAPGSLMAFYRRRFWRIAPAYFVTLAATLVAGFALLLPIDVERLGMSAVAAAFFVPNFFFSSGAGYFDTASIYKPLLHTWSLGVEAQFYLVWPFVILGVLKPPTRWRVTALGCALALSFALCQILAIADPKVAFFSLPARIWQFSLGALMALDFAPRVRTFLKPASSPLQWLSLAAIVATPWFVREGDAWPAPWAAPACVATALLIGLGGEGACSRLLGSAPFVFLGRISYSLYLVHWPVVVFAGYRSFPQSSVATRIAALFVCIPLAMALYHFVEAPLRTFGRTRDHASMARGAMALLATLCVGIGYAAHRAPQQFSLLEAPAAGEPPLDAFACSVWRAPGSDRAFCRIGDRASEPSVLLWGDSHGMHFAQGFAALLAQKGGSIIAAVKDSCPPVAGLYRVSNALVRREDCPRDNAAILAAALAAPGIETIVIAARWAYYADTTRFGAEKGGRSFIVTDQQRDLSIDVSRKILETKLDDEVGALTAAGKKVVLLAQAPELGFDGPRCVLMSALAHGPANACDIARARVDQRQAYASAMLARIAARHAGVRILDPRAVLCDESACRGTLDGRAVWRDDNHLTAAAAARVVEKLFDASK